MNADTGNQHAARTSDAPEIPLLDRLLFVVLAAILCARPLISESFCRVEFTFLPTGAPLGPTPATTTWLDGVLLAAAAIVGIRYWRPSLRVGVITVGLLLLLLAVIVSTAAAHDKRLAANAGAELFVLAVAAVALVRLMRARWMRHLLIAALLASGVTNAVKCMTQRAYEFSDSLEYWQEQKPSRVASGVDLNSPAVINYERRLRSAEAFGYLSHPNVTGSCLTMCLLAAGGLLTGVLRKPGREASRKAAAAVVAGALALALAVGLWLTKSTGAMVAAVGGGLLLLAFGLTRDWVTRNARATLAILLAGYCGAIAAGAAYGLLKGTLPTASLAFRWQYWRAAAPALEDAPLTGIGRENFRQAYLLYKSPESTEEVTDPHDLWISLLVELGPLGLAAGVLLAGAAVYAAVRRLSDPGHTPPTASHVGAAIAVALGVLLVQAVFSGEPFSAAGVPLLWATLVAAVWVLVFLAAYSLAAQVDEDAGSSAWLAAGLGAALCAALVHNLIGFSLLTPAGLSLFVGFGACVSSESFARKRATVTSFATSRGVNVARAAAALVLSTLIVAVYAYTVVVPTSRGEALLQGVRATAQTRPPAWAAIEAAVARGGGFAVDAWDADLPRTVAEMVLALAKRDSLPEAERREGLDLAERYARLAWARDHYSFATARSIAEILDTRAAITDNDDDRMAAAKAWQTATMLYSTDPRAQIRAGDAWFELWRRNGEAGDARRAAEHFKTALEIDATRLPEVAAKLRQAEVQTIRQRLDELERSKD